jgi:hypothetical protein
MGFVLTHVLTPAYVATTPLGFAEAFWVIWFRWRVLGYGGKGCYSLANVETGLGGEAIDTLDDDETC